uniref:DNA2/NAM7 helicase-like C-terminal domain-containing protein n=1 Tax=Panagrolaimus sp. ES5 TaxID=591445 RepID=A0AC34G5A3_9BILA
MHPAIVKVMNELFYLKRNLMPLFPPSSLNLNFLRNHEIPIAFYNVNGGDKHVPPTTRRNLHQNYVGMKIIEQLLEYRQHDFREKILALCNYSAERQLMEETLKKKG